MNRNTQYAIEYFARIAQNFQALSALSELIIQSGDILTEAIRAGNKVMFCGNGGSAADAQHLAAELMGRYLKDREPMAAISLSVDTSALTAIGNDYGFDDVFSRQVRGLGRRGDVLVAISTSGNSRNVIKAVETATALGISSIALTGQGGRNLATISNVAICVPSDQTNHIQEMHIAIGHFLCGYVEDHLC